LKAKVNVQYAQRLSSHPTENTGTLGECLIGQQPVLFSFEPQETYKQKYTLLVLKPESTYIHHLALNGERFLGAGRVS